MLEKCYDTKTYLHFEGWICIISSLGLLVSMAGVYFNIIWLMFCGLGYIILINACSMIYTKRGKRFLK